MRKNTVKFIRTIESGTYQTIFKTLHGRVIYLEVEIKNGMCAVLECFYLDRAEHKDPKKLMNKHFPHQILSGVITIELDRPCTKVRFCNDVFVEKAEFISGFLGKQKKKILLMLKDGDKLKTIFKNRHRREIYLEISLDENGNGVITECRYCDKRAGDCPTAPQGLTTIKYDHNLEKLLDIVNGELEGGFGAIAIASEHTIDLKEAICGRI